MNTLQADLLTGELVRLAVDDPQVVAEAFSRWASDTEYWRLLATDAARAFSTKSTQEWLEKDLLKDPPGFYLFLIRTLEGDRLIGEVGLDSPLHLHGETFVGISLGEREDWGKGYGTDAMHLILRFAFQELNLERVSLTVFEYNPRAMRSYEKAGFTYEGRQQGFLNRGGKRWDLIYMGILREEWERYVNFST